MKNLITSMILAILLLMGYDPQVLAPSVETSMSASECSGPVANDQAAPDASQNSERSFGSVEGPAPGHEDEEYEAEVHSR